ncbi:MAG: hypothetical protein M0R03_03795 [Novosphingobium sp.]|nr:hypothetical protein [Novosphingobium sp.]
MKISPKIDLENFDGRCDVITYCKEYLKLYKSVVGFIDEVFIKIPSFEYNISLLKEYFSKLNNIKINWVIAHGDYLQEAIFSEENNIDANNVYFMIEDLRNLQFYKDKKYSDNIIVGTKTISKLSGMSYELLSEIFSDKNVIFGGFSEKRILDKRFNNITTKYFVARDIIEEYNEDNEDIARDFLMGCYCHIKKDEHNIGSNIPNTTGV